MGNQNNLRQKCKTTSNSKTSLKEISKPLASFPSCNDWTLRVKTLELYRPLKTSLQITKISSECHIRTIICLSTTPQQVLATASLSKVRTRYNYLSAPTSTSSPSKAFLTRIPLRH